MLLTAGMCHGAAGMSDVIRFRTLGSVLRRRKEASRQWKEREVCREGKIIKSIGMDDEYIDK